MNWHWDAWAGPRRSGELHRAPLRRQGLPLERSHHCHNKNTAHLGWPVLTVTSHRNMG